MWFHSIWHDLSHSQASFHSVVYEVGFDHLFLLLMYVLKAKFLSFSLSWIFWWVSREYKNIFLIPLMLMSRLIWSLVNWEFEMGRHSLYVHGRKFFTDNWYYWKECFKAFCCGVFLKAASFFLNEGDQISQLFFQVKTKPSFVQRKKFSSIILFKMGFLFSSP